MSRSLHCAPAPCVWTAALASLLLAGCGGGGGGGGGVADTTLPAPPPVAAADIETLPTARAVFDAARATAFLAADVQNLIVMAPSLLARGDSLERCDQGGSLQTTVLRPESHPDGPLLRQQFSDCLASGIRISGSTEVGYSRRIRDAPNQPWAGSVRFHAYRIDATVAPLRQRTYDGLATGEGSLGTTGSPQQARRVVLTGFSLRDNPDTLGRGDLVSTTDRFELQRGPGGLGDPLTLQGRWEQASAALRVTLTLDAGSQLSMVENVGDEAARGSLVWADGTAASFSGRFVIAPSARSAVRLTLDLGSDGSIDRDRVLDRYTQIGVGI